MTEKTSRHGFWNLWLLAVVILTGLVLRLYFANHSNLYIDEFTTIWAGQRVLSHGVPRFPLGAIYTQGLFYTYLEAAALSLASTFHPLLARLPSLALSAITLALAAYAARALFRTVPVGLAALWLALDGESIVWGSRVRTYALLQPLVLGAFLAWYLGAVAQDRPGLRWLAIGLLLVALVDQQVTLLLLPPLVILALVARGRGWLRQPVVWLQAGVLALGLAGRWLLFRLMVLPGTAATEEPRVFVDLFHPLAGWETVVPFVTDPNRVLAALLVAGGVLWWLLRGRRRPVRPTWAPPVLSIAFLLAFVVLEMVLVVGTSWRRARYLYPLVPLLFLAAEGVAVPVLRRLARRLSFIRFSRALAALSVASVLLIVGLGFQGSRTAVTAQEWGYDRALAFVSRNWSEGDALATIAPAAGFVILGRGDYLAAEEGAQMLTVERDGRRLDSWTGLPLLDSPSRLLEVLEAHPRLWFVADEMRLDRHFSPEFLRLLWDRFDLVAFEWGTFVFRSRPPQPPPAVDRAVGADLDGQLRLDSYALSAISPSPGEAITVTLRWAPIAPQGEYSVAVRLVNPQGETVSAHDAPPLDGLYPPFRWAWSPDSQPFPDRHRLVLPPDLPPGRYRLDAGLYRPQTGEPVGDPVTLDFLTVGEVVIDDHEPAFSAQLAPGSYRLIAGPYRPDGTRLALKDGSSLVEVAVVELGQ